MITKEEFIKACEKYIALKEAMRKLYKDSDFFCITEEVSEIHISAVKSNGIDFNYLASICKAVVICNPNFTDRVGEKYFYIPINGKNIKVFALWNKHN